MTPELKIIIYTHTLAAAGEVFAQAGAPGITQTERFSPQSFAKGMKQKIQRENLQGALEAAGSRFPVPSLMQHQCSTVVISANCYLPLAAEYLQGIQFHCIFANKSQMTLRKTAVFSCLYPLISSAE